MRIIFMGNPEFVIPVLSSLSEAGHDIVAVYTGPDMPSGRGHRLNGSAVKQYASENGFLIRQPKSIRDYDLQREMESLAPDLIVVAAYGLFLPSEILQLPPLGCLNLHPSLLPKYRGPSPVASAILDGADVTGVSIIRLDQGVDSGPVLAKRRTSIRGRENALDLTIRLFQIGAELLVDSLNELKNGNLVAQPQDSRDITVTRKFLRGDGKVEWAEGALDISRKIRAYYPWPGSFTYWQGKLLKIIEGSVAQTREYEPWSIGSVVSIPDGPAVMTGEDLLVIAKVQLEGAKVMNGKEFVRGYPKFIGSTVGDTSDSGVLDE